MADLRCSVTRIKFDMQQRSALHAGPALQSTVTRPKYSNATTKQGNIGMAAQGKGRTGQPAKAGHAQQHCRAGGATAQQEGRACARAGPV